MEILGQVEFTHTFGNSQDQTSLGLRSILMTKEFSNVISKNNVNDLMHLCYFVECPAACCNMWKYKIVWLHYSRKSAYTWFVSTSVQELLWRYWLEFQLWKMWWRPSLAWGMSKWSFPAEAETQVCIETFQNVSDLPNTVGGIYWQIVYTSSFPSIQCCELL